ncbi:GH92 family glycosyl hydrolase [Streptomyces sp. NPDC059740]|uniref:GH92 family glycosyl hydrolase n=1 Tax=Streptomyces sp. NPDC059740 TaxID=3346926 RepID=UPI00364A5B4E
MIRRRPGLAAALAVGLLWGGTATAQAVPTTLSNQAGGDPAPLVQDATSYVDPLNGTGKGGDSVGEINNFPGPSTPFGMMQFSPDTEGSYAGYQYHSDHIRGFSLDHASVGCSAFGDVPLLPVTGALGDTPWNRTESFSHDQEEASPGYYAVTLKDSDVRAELTADTRTGLAAFTYPAGSEAKVLVKGGGSFAGDSAADLHISGDRTLTGSATTGNFCGKGNKYTVHYAVTFDRPFAAHGTWDGKKVTAGSDGVDSPKAGAYLTFDTASSRTVRAKISMSYVSVAGAQANMAAEVPGWDLAAQRAETRQRWREALGRVQVAGRDKGQLETFYTSLYHSLMHPNTFDDVDGRYTGFDGKVRTLPNGHHQYANFSDWDTYRTLAPLQAMLFPGQAGDMAQSLVNDARQSGWWPRWPLANGTTGQMTGDNSVPLVANLYVYGARDFDVDTALKYLVKGATTEDSSPGAYRERPGVADYVRLGYDPNNENSRGDHQRTGASTTLEWAIDDFAISRLAAATGEKKTAEEFGRRGQNWQNLLNPATHYLQPRDEAGHFPEGPAYVPPKEGEFGQDGFDEGNVAQYSWLVPQNQTGLVTAIGGRTEADKRLDAFFADDLNSGPNKPTMWAGNEVNFGVPWTYNAVGKPWKTQATVRKIATSLFSATPDGQPGNDDLGAMSSWYVWAALGVYPSAPGTTTLSVHSPLFQQAVLHLPHGRTLQIRAPRAATDAPYVHGLTLNGRSWQQTSLPADLVSRGGRLDFSLATEPDTSWATGPAAAPTSHRTGEHGLLAGATPAATTLAPGEETEVTVYGQRLASHAKDARVRTSAPDGLTVRPAAPVMHLDGTTGAGELALRVTAGAHTPAGAYHLPVTLRAGRDEARYTVTVTVTG